MIEKTYNDLEDGYRWEITQEIDEKRNVIEEISRKRLDKTITQDSQYNELKIEINELKDTINLLLERIKNLENEVGI